MREERVAVSKEWLRSRGARHRLGKRIHASLDSRGLVSFQSHRLRDVLG